MKARLLIEVSFREYLITSDVEKMFPEQIHAWLSEESYWAKNIPFETILSAIQHSFCLGILLGAEQIGFARLVTDYSKFAHLADVYVKQDHRKIGLSKQMLRILLDLDWVKKLRAIQLGTLDAHELYKQFGFQPLDHPERTMQIRRESYGSPP